MKVVLVVEDEYGTAQALRLLLDAEGFAVELAANGRVALERIAQRRPDLIVSDYMMPVLGGAALGRTIRASAEWARIPVVIMSAAPESRVRRDFADLDGFLRKPFDPDELIALAKRLTERGRR